MRSRKASRKPKGPENRRLALPVPPPPRRDPTPVRVELLFIRDTADAWFLKRAGLEPKWAPKSQVTRGEGRDENVFTMPRWVAVERGWV